MYTGNTWRLHTKYRYFFWPSCENLGIIYFELFNCVNQHQSQTIFFFALIVFQSNALESPLDGFTSPQLLDASKCLQEI